jgi:hypothetical protein
MFSQSPYLTKLIFLEEINNLTLALEGHENEYQKANARFSWPDLFSRLKVINRARLTSVGLRLPVVTVIRLGEPHFN